MSNYTRIFNCDKYHSNIVKKQLFTQIRRLQIKHEKNMPNLSTPALFKHKTATNVPSQLAIKSQHTRDKCRHFKNCDTGHSKKILNTCYRLRMDAQPCRKSTFLFKHNTLLSTLAHGKSNVQVINMSLLYVKSKLTLYTKTKSAVTNVPIELQFYRKLGGDKCRCHLRQDPL